MATFNVKSHSPLAEILVLRIDGSDVSSSATSTDGVDEGFTMVTALKGTSGTSNEVSITLNEASVRTPVVLGGMMVATNGLLRVKSVSTTVIIFETFAVADGTTAVDDADFHAAILIFKQSTQYE